MTPGERFLGLLYAGCLRDLKIYYSYLATNPNAEYPEQKHFCHYFQSVMLFSNRLGHLWGFREQKLGSDWTSPTFPYGEIEPLHWTVKTWEAQKRDESADQVEELFIPAPVPAEWEAIDVPPVYPGIEENQFVLRLGLSDERKYQYAYT
jgi:hypothetical protein